MPLDMGGQRLVNLCVPRDWLLLAGPWIRVDVVPRTVAQQDTPLRHKLAHELPAPHTTISLIS